MYICFVVLAYSQFLCLSHDKRNISEIKKKINVVLVLISFFKHQKYNQICVKKLKIKKRTFTYFQTYKIIIKIK